LNIHLDGCYRQYSMPRIISIVAWKWLLRGNLKCKVTTLEPRTVTAVKEAKLSERIGERFSLNSIGSLRK